MKAFLGFLAVALVAATAQAAIVFDSLHPNVGETEKILAEKETEALARLADALSGYGTNRLRLSLAGSITVGDIVITNLTVLGNLITINGISYYFPTTVGGTNNILVNIGGGTNNNLQWYNFNPNQFSINQDTNVHIKTGALTTNLVSRDSLTVPGDGATPGSIVWKATNGTDGITLKSPNTVTSYVLTWPSAQGAASSTILNNGSGVLSWGTAGPGFGDLVWTNESGQVHLVDWSGRVLLQRTNQSSQSQFPFYVSLQTEDDGGTNGFSEAIRGINRMLVHVAGGTESALNDYGGAAGVYGDSGSQNSTDVSGEHVGVFGVAGGVDFSIGYGVAGYSKPQAGIGIGVGGSALQPDGVGFQVGLYGEVITAAEEGVSPASLPSAALVLDNRATGLPLIVGRTNNATTVFQVAYNGALTVNNDDYTLSDVTTANASTSKHGFLKKLSNTATQYMDGTGNWSTPAGSGGTVTGSGTTGRVAYWSGSTTLGDSGIIWTNSVLNLHPSSGSTSTKVLFPDGTGTVPGIAFEQDSRIGFSRVHDSALTVVVPSTTGAGTGSPLFEFGSTDLFGVERFGPPAADSGTAAGLAMRVHGGVAIGSNTAGGDLQLAGGNGTGSGRGGAVVMRTALAVAGASTVNSDTPRSYVSSKETTLTESSATLLATVSVSSGKVLGIILTATTRATDGTDHQVVVEKAAIAVANKAGTVTTTVSTSAPTATLQTSGTLTTAITAVANGSNVDIKMNATSSLTQTALATMWRLELDSIENVVVSPN